MQTPAMRRVVVVMLTFLMPVLMMAQGAIDLTKVVEPNPAIKIGTLSNGLKYYIYKNGKPEKRLELMLAVNAGAVLEDDDQNGLAHFCEHMAFNGTKSFPKQELVSFLESTGIRFGADLNAYTNQDETVYMLTIPLDKPETMEKGFQVLRDWAHYVSFDDKEIDAERGVIMEEWRLGKGADDRVREKHAPFMYFGSKYAKRDVIGDTNVLRKAPHDNFRRFYRDWYRPENMAVVVVGDADPSKLEELVKKNFNFPATPASKIIKRPSMPLPPHAETLISIASDQELTVASAMFMVKRPATTTATLGDFRNSIVEQLMTSMIDSRYAELSRKPNPPFLGAGVGAGRFVRENDALFASVTAADKNVLKSFDAMLTELERAVRHGFTETELQRAKDAMMARMEQYYNERDKSESSGFAREFVRNFLVNEGIPGIVREYAIYQQLVPTVTADDCKKALIAAYGKENRVITFSVPEKGGYRIPKESDVRNLLAAIAEKDIQPYVDNVVTKPLIASLPAPGTIVKEEKLAEVDAVKLTLSNGATVIYKKTEFKNDEIMFSAMSWGGTNAIKTEDLLSAQMAAGIVDEGGIADIDATALGKMLQGKNISISPYVSADMEGFSGGAAPKDLRTMMELLHLYFTAPRKDKDAFTSAMQKMKTQLENKSANPELALMDTLTVAMYNNNPRRQPMSLERMSEIDLDKAYNIYRQRFANPADFTYMFVGNVDPDTIKAFAAAYIASLPASGPTEKYTDDGVRPVNGKLDRMVNKGKEPKSTVVRMLRLPMAYTPQNRYAVIALTEVLSIRLREQLREEKGGVYGVAVQPQISKYPEEQAGLLVYFGCAPDRVDELLSTVDKEFAYMMANRVDESYIQKVKEIQVKEREVGKKTNGFWMNGIRSSIVNNEPLTTIALRDELIAKLTAEQVQQTAKTVLSTKNVATFVLKPE
ncbi:MAG: insulinase family protein [Candidatus Kapabacteria bacterium]|nr:insulinase family protein [Candidatus Kapabacteria bacterium]